MAAAIRIVVASAHDATRAGIRQALDKQRVDVCGEAVDADSAVEVVARSGPDCCLIGVNLPGNALAAVPQIRARAPQTTVIALADEPNPKELLSCIRAGAAGYLPKSMNPDRLAATVADACNGGAAIPRRLVTSLVDAVRTGWGRPPTGLPSDVESRMSRRELEVLELLRGGESTGTIAAVLSVSPITVRRHISSIVDKLGVANRRAAVELLARASTGAPTTVRARRPTAVREPEPS